MRVLGIADSDSYVKWGAAMLQRMPVAWQTELAVLRTPALPSAAQLESALTGTRFTRPELLDLRDIAARVARDRPDAVFLAVRGPVVRVLVRAIVSAGVPRPVILSGLPGISIPETLNAVYYRSQVDLFVLHSKREVRAFSALAERLGAPQQFLLATLPFLPSRERRGLGGDDIVFAAQAKVPRTEADRRHLLERVLEIARRRPDSRVVLKLRARLGEAQTHHERYPYDVLLADHPDVPDNVVVHTGPMSEALEQAAALVTVSSTAAIEAIAVGVPVIAIDDFGVSAQAINIVFEGSGLLAPSDEAIAGRFREPDEGWLDDNYFHAPTDDDWIDALDLAVRRRDAGELPLRPQFRGRFGGALRRTWDRKIALGRYDESLAGTLAYAVGSPLRGLVRRYRRLRARAARASGRELQRTP